VQLSSSPVMRRPRDEEALSLEQVNRGGSVPVSLSVMELGTPRGKDTTIGSYSGLLGDTSTLMDAVRLFLDGFLVGDDVALSDLRFFVLVDAIVLAIFPSDIFGVV